MADDEDRPVKVRERLLQHAQAGEIEVVRRLVEDDDVASTAENFREQEAGAFAAGELVHAFLHAGFIEQKPSQIGAGGEGLVSEGDHLAGVRDLVHDCALPVQLHPRLVDIIEDDPFSDGCGALRGSQLAQAEPEKRRFADTVPADDSGALAGPEREVHVSEKPAAGCSGAHPGSGEFDGRVANFRGGRDEKIHLALFRRRLHAGDLVERIQAVLGF